MPNTRTTALVMMVMWLVTAGASVAAMNASPAGEPQAAAQPAPQEPQDQFVPLKNLPTQEQIPASTLVLTAYAFVWAVLLVYVWTIWRRLMKVEREMKDLAGRIDEKGARR